MKLVELLARELGEWPVGDGSDSGWHGDFAAITQDIDGTLWGWGKPNPVCSDGLWLSPYETGGENQVMLFMDDLPGVEPTLSDDRDTAIVTRDQWQAERDRLTAEGEELTTLRIAAEVSAADANDAERALAGAQVEADTWEQRAVKEATRVVELEAQRDELVAALESLMLFTIPKPSNAVALNNAYQVITKAKGGAQ